MGMAVAQPSHTNMATGGGPHPGHVSLVVTWAMDIITDSGNGRTIDLDMALGSIQGLNCGLADHSDWPGISVNVTFEYQHVPR